MKRKSLRQVGRENTFLNSAVLILGSELLKSNKEHIIFKDGFFSPDLLNTIKTASKIMSYKQLRYPKSFKNEVQEENE